MHLFIDRTRKISRALVAGLLAGAACAAAAHGAKVGDIAIGHPYATPSIPGTSNGAAYLASLENKGATADRLVHASTPMAARVISARLGSPPGSCARSCS